MTSILDIAIDHLHDLKPFVKAEVQRRFERRPFRQEERSNDEQLYEYNQLTDQQRLELYATDPAESHRLEELKRRRMGDAT